jgi:molybdate/tungstate transport system ATP-binding protein
MIRVDALTVRLPGFTLDGVTFEIAPGRVGVVTGPTGAGKTTLLETIAGVRPINAGRITLGSIDVSRLPPEQRHVGLVYQQAWLFPHLTVQENIAYGAASASIVTEITALLHLGELIGKPLLTLSGGERQLVALARTLAHEPRTLLLDEPFAAMDSTLRQQIRTTVLSWAAARQVTTLLVTHDVSEAALAGSVQLRIARGVLTVSQ